MSSLQVPLNSVWSSMHYTPPRGPCNFKGSIMSGTCPCLRFMLHPVKAATSFECDGCGHHASFHNLENPKEDKILQEWNNQQQAAILAVQQTPNTNPARNKRRRITEQAQDQGFVVTDLTANEEDELLGSGTGSATATPRTTTKALRNGRNIATGR
ncbi:hypothetical protein MBLNU459_g2236t1 [Dothideomycetes sp. NU459]